MAAELHIRLFGGWHIARNGAPLTTFISNKVPALLAYLAVNPRPHQRDTLAALLWGEMPDSDAKNNLRQALSNLRKLLGDHLIITRDHAAFDLSQPHFVDINEFALGVRANSALLPSQQAEQYRQAVALYRGEFLEGIALRDAPEFDDWLVAQRAHWRELALHTLYILTEYYLRQREYNQAIASATHLLALDPWREEAHRHLMIALQRTGQRAAALQQYETCRHLLDEAMGVEPSAETRKLYERLRHAGDKPHHNLLPTLTSFVGRNAELAQIIALLTQPTSRLVTITGIGGVGKSRLAQEVAYTLAADFSDGVWHIPLNPVNRADDIAAAIAAPIGLIFSGAAAPESQLLDYLQPRELLLILDNFEHLLNETSLNLIRAILNRASDVRLLVTSHERLNLQAETLLELGGLPYPNSEPLVSQWPGGESGVAVQEMEYPARQLFIERAGRLQAGFAAAGHEKALSQLCRLVDGLPLALELAATWIRTLSLSDIVTEIERGIDFLATTLRDMPARHRSLRAVFDYSWQLLTPEEQTACRRLAVFRGGFTAQAARTVTGASLFTLAGLVDKSFMRLEQSGPHHPGRYRRHPLLIQYAYEKLNQDPTEHRQMVMAHAHYFASFLTERASRLDAAEPAAFAEVQAELDNCRTAWRAALAQRQTILIQQMTAPFTNYYARQGSYIEIVPLLQEAINCLSQTINEFDETLETRQALLGELTFWLGRMHLFLSQYPQAHETLLTAYQTVRHLEEPWLEGRIMGALFSSLAWMSRYGEALRMNREAMLRAEAAQDTTTIVEMVNGLGVIASHQGNYQAARQQFQRSYDLYRQHNFPEVYLTGPLLNLGSMAVALGEYAAALPHLEACLALTQRYNNRYMSGLVLRSLAKVHRNQGQLAEARRYLEQALTLYRDLRSAGRISEGLHQLAAVVRQQGNLTLAESLLREGLELAQATSNQTSLGYIYGNLADVKRQQQQWLAAQDYLKKALKIGLVQEQLPVGLYALNVVADLALDAGEMERAVALWQGILAHERADAEDKTQARGRLQEAGVSEQQPSHPASWQEMAATSLTWLETPMHQPAAL